MHPSHRYERLCKMEDLEIRLSLQAINLDPSKMSISSFCSTPAYPDIFAPLSPSPTSHRSADISARAEKLEVLEGDQPVSASLYNSLVLAAHATRTSKHFSNLVLPSGSHPVHPVQQSSAHRYGQAPSEACSTMARPLVPRKLENSTQQSTSFHTARSRLLRSRLHSTRNQSDTNNTGPGLNPNPCTSTPSSLNGRQLLGPKRPRFGNPAPQQQSTSKMETNEDIPEVPNVDPKLVQLIMNETLEKSPGVDWDDIAGLCFAKQCVMEAVVWPMLRPDIFSGLRGPPKGLLLFGPPGTGKTMIGRAIASKSGAKFFNISASSLISKWAGEGEKTVRALFGVARIFQVRKRQPKFVHKPNSPNKKIV